MFFWVVFFIQLLWFILWLLALFPLSAAFWVAGHPSIAEEQTTTLRRLIALSSPAQGSLLAFLATPVSTSMGSWECSNTNPK